MLTHIIYHIPGVKVGCTSNFQRRRGEYKPDVVIEILEELHDKTDRQAGEIEWDWADKFGYRRGRHYADMASAEARQSASEGGAKGGRKTAISHSREWFSTHGRKRGKISGDQYVERTSSEQRIENARNAAIRQRLITPIEQQVAIARKGGRRSVELEVGIHARTSEQISSDSKKGALRILELGLSGFQQQVICPNCGLKGNLANLKRWHFDKCKTLGPHEAVAPMPEAYR